MMLCENGTLPTGYAASGAGYPQLPYTLFAVNLNPSVGAIGNVLWSKTYIILQQETSLSNSQAQTQQPTSSCFHIKEHSNMMSLKWYSRRTIYGVQLQRKQLLTIT